MEETQLDRIEHKLDVLLSALPKRECIPQSPPHTHSDSPYDFHPLRMDEAPYSTCYYRGLDGREYKL